jgi:hypothetical protein
VHPIRFSTPASPTDHPRTRAGDARDRSRAPVSDGHNSHAGNGVASHQDRLSHALPSKDPDLAFIVRLWDRLADEIKARLIEMVRANLPTEPTKGTTHSEK